MQKTNSNMTAKTTRRKVKSSTTLNRRYVRRPSSEFTMDSAMSVGQVTQNTTSQRMVAMQSRERAMKIPVKANNANMTTDAFSASPVQAVAASRMRERQNRAAQMATASAVSAKELKEKAIQKALATASSPIEDQKSKKQRHKKDGKVYFGFGRVMLALACAAATAFAIVYFVDLNMPDISLKVAAMQTGINASYPGYIPRDYSISSITSESGKIILDFKNSSTGEEFSLIEEASSWDSNALMTNYIKEEFNSNYATVKEQGITIYIDGSNAAWVNGGIIYKLNAATGTLTNKQIKSIAVSL